MESFEMKYITLIFIFNIISLAYAESPVPGNKAPDFDLPDQDGVFHQLSDYKGRWLVLYFYPKDDTPGCTKEAQAFSRDISEFNQLNTEVVGISIDTVESHKDFSKKYDIPYTLLADKDGVMASAYNVYKNKIIMKYASRQTFIVNPDGLIVKHYEEVSPDTHSQEVIRDINQFKTMKKL